MPRREAIGRVERKDTYTASMNIVRLVYPRRFVSHLDKGVSRYSSLLTHLPQNSLHTVVVLPDTLQQGWNDVLVLSGTIERDTTRETEVVDVIREGTHIVERKLGIPEFLTYSPVMPKIPSPVLRITVKTRAVHFKLFIRQLNKT
jgi:hypothetical protein